MKILLRLLFASLVSSALAAEVDVQGNGSTTWKAGMDGVEVVWNPDGSVQRLYSRYNQPVEFPDRRGIHTAQVIAEEKAKGAIVRFMNQCVTSSRIVTEMENDLNKATQTRQSGSRTAATKVDERLLVTNLTEITASFSAGKLPGVIILEKGYDEKAEEAWVVVGMSQKTINAARAVKDMTSRPPARDEPNATQKDNLGLQGSEVRRSGQSDW